MAIEDVGAKIVLTLHEIADALALDVAGSLTAREEASGPFGADELSLVVGYGTLIGAESFTVTVAAEHLKQELLFGVMVGGI